MGGLAAFVLARARARRTLLAAALLTVLLTTAVLATLTAYSGAIGDAALRHSLRDPATAADTALLVEADVPAARREAAAHAVREGARRAFDGLPVTVRTLTRSGPYALPRTGDRRSADPDLTHFAALDPGQVRFVAGRPPRDRAGTVEAALPAVAADRLGLRPGARLTLTDRLGGPPVRVEITGLYRPADTGAPYWRLDDLGGRGVRKGDFTTYGPLLAASGTLTGGRVSAGSSGWLAAADFSTLTADRTGALRAAAREGPRWLRGRPVLSGTTAARTSLPEVLDRLDRSLVVARSTLLVIALQLALLAVCALLLVARLLSAERAGELRLLRARGASRARLAGLSALEALLLAAPAALAAPLLAGPLTRLLAGQGPLARIGLRPQVPLAGDGTVRWVALAVALGCALAVTLPALTSSPAAGGRARPLPAPLRAGADLALLAVAGVAYWQLSGEPSGAVTADTSGGLGVDPLLVAAPALALLAGTVLTLRLLPPVARLAERRAAGGRGLTVALAGWQLSRRPARGTGPVLLLVLAVALGTLAVGQGASWDRSQDDQADFRAGAPVRVLGTGAARPGRTEALAAVPGVERAAPAARSELPLSGDRTATVLALDTARAADTMLLRRDLAPVPRAALLAGPAPDDPAPGAAVPAGATALGLTARLRSDAGPGTTADVTVTVEDRYGVPYPLSAGDLPADGRPHTLTVALTGGPLTVTGVELVLVQPIGRAERHRFTLTGLTATAADGTARGLPLPRAWTAVSHGDGLVSGPDARTAPTRARLRSSAPPAVEYGTGYTPADQTWASSSLTVRLRVARPAPPPVTAVATDRFLASAGARTGQRLDVAFGGTTVPVRITRSVRELPSTARENAATGDGGALLVDLRAVNRVLRARYGAGVTPTEWWLATAPGAARKVAAALRAFPDLDPAQVVVRDELAEKLRDDPFGAGPGAVFTAAAGVAAALAAVGFAVGAAGSLRERGREFAVLRALGAPRRGPARTVAVEQGVLIGLALGVGTALGVLLTRAVVPLIVLTPGAARPVPEVLVELPVPRLAALLTAVALVPVLTAVTLAARGDRRPSALREQGGDMP
ncbi:ABC transporter permease [Streptomyces fumanus]|uniref:ABC transporter permease n=1 Tax=Streptomyces fumanus TaxID=67302 RepID=UPI0033F8E12E